LQIFICASQLICCPLRCLGACSSGLIFLFKYQPSPLNPATQTLITPEDPRSEQIYFARQMITNASVGGQRDRGSGMCTRSPLLTVVPIFSVNAVPSSCGTQAILNLILNLDDDNTSAHGITLGEELKNFKEFTRFLPPDMRGEAISNSELIRTAHNAFARPEPFIFEEKKPSRDSGGEDAFHFIGYVPINGQLYELDGLKPGPILLHHAGGEAVTQDNWMAAARTAIQARLAHYASKEIRFNLMALIGNQAEQIKKKIAAIDEQIAAAKGTSASAAGSADAAAAAAPAASGTAAAPMDTDAVDSSTVSLLEDERAQLKRQLEDEEHKMERWRVENMRRKHNYVRTTRAHTARLQC